MKFIVILICVAINRYWMGSHPLYVKSWFEQVLKNERTTRVISSLPVELKFLILVGIPVAIAALLFWQLHDWIWGMGWMVGALLVLTYSIGVSTLDYAVTEHSMWLRKQQLSGTVEELAEKHQSAVKNFVYDEFSKVYPVLFWFMLLGPAGALLYSLSRQYSAFDALSEGDRRIADTVVHTLEWLPARITGFAFGVVGVFTHSTRRLVDSLLDWDMPAKNLLFDLAELAVAVNESESADTQQFLRKAGLEVKAVQELLHRVLLCWIALLAVFTLVGWG
jgi:AmpE protein